MRLQIGVIYSGKSVFPAFGAFGEHQACRHFPQFGPAGAEGVAANVQAMAAREEKRA